MTPDARAWLIAIAWGVIWGAGMAAVAFLVAGIVWEWRAHRP